MIHIPIIGDLIRDRIRLCRRHSEMSVVKQTRLATFRQQANHSTHAVTICLAVFLGALLCLGAEAAEPPLDDFFENQIRPLLVRHCIDCHGPKKSESGLRLDSIDAAIKGGDRGPAIVPGVPQESLILKALHHEADLEMPPDEKLPNREIEIFTRWVKDGAIWPAATVLGGNGPQLRSGEITDQDRKFWSLQDVSDPAPPLVEDGLVHNEIDRFILKRLQARQLKPLPPATKRVLIRRATFDLTGLPPQPADIEGFLNDHSPAAFAKVIDRLLASNSYGERWGRHWLDVVRYADTAGDTGDYPTPLSYKYRNWVINALNADKPYDVFVREQIAGDVLADLMLHRRAPLKTSLQPVDQPTTVARQLSEDLRQRYEDMLTATGFIAISRRFGFDVENYHHLTIQDTIDTVGQAILGLSLGCARCHDHKYDPVNVDDYYAWYGIFDSTRYSFPGSEEKKRPYDSFPVLPPHEAEQAKAEFDSRLVSLESQIKQLEEEKQQLAKRGTTWQQYLKTHRLMHRNKDHNGYRGLNVWHGDPLPVVGVNTSEETQNIPGTVPPKHLVVHPAEEDGVGIGWRSPLSGAIRIRGHLQDAHECGNSIAWFVDRLGTTKFQPLGSGELEPGESQTLEEIVLHVQAGDFLQLAIMPKGSHGCDLTQVELTIDTEDGEQHWSLQNDVVWSGMENNPQDDQDENPEVWHFYRVIPDRGQSFAASLSSESATLDPVAWERKSRQVDQDLENLAQHHLELKSQEPYELVYAAIEKSDPQDAQIRLRGDRHKLGDVVPRKNLNILGNDPLPASAGSGRLELAEWLTRDANPLFARVMVNRIWQHHFGRGIVATENNFGVRGVKPSHPDLLDWLASRFRESGYSIKAMHRLIMTSATYQRSSAFAEVAANVDPEAKLLWRFRRRRLSAEEFRDALLSLSGELDSTMGRAHPFPDIETWAFSQHAPYYGIYPTNQRSVYLMQQRLKRHPFLALFDGADPNVSTARRELTTVPTQALYLMNNEFVHEQSKALAQRLTNQFENEHSRINATYLMILGRHINDDEQAESAAFITAYKNHLIETEPSSNVREQTALAGLVRTLFTRNEFLFVD